jgi:hypothetical protein
MISYIFILYCVAGCEASQPHHRIHSAFDTIERCEQVRRDLVSVSTSTYSCERTTFESSLQHKERSRPL